MFLNLIKLLLKKVKFILIAIWRFFTSDDDENDNDFYSRQY